MIIIEINLFAKNKLKFKCNKSRFHSNYCYLNYYVQFDSLDGFINIIRGCICSSVLVQQNLDMHLYKVYGIFSHKDHCPRIYISPKLIILLNPQKIFPQTLMKAQYVEQQCGKIVRFIIYGINSGMVLYIVYIYMFVEKHISIWFDLHCTIFIRKSIPYSTNHCIHLQI